MAPLFAWVLIAAACEGAFVWEYTHAGSGETTATIGDLLPRNSSGIVNSPQQRGLSGMSLRQTGFGTASTKALARHASVVTLRDKEFEIEQSADAFGSNAVLADGDRLGGEASASLTSEWTVVLPLDTTELEYLLAGQGRPDVTVEIRNDRSGLLLSLTSPTTSSSSGPFVAFPGPIGRAGDRIRITTSIEVSGFFRPNVAPPNLNELASFRAVFRVPEPSSVLLALLGLSLLAPNLSRSR